MFMWVKSVFPKPFAGFTHPGTGGKCTKPMQTLSLPARKRFALRPADKHALIHRLRAERTVNGKCGGFL